MENLQRVRYDLPEDIAQGPQTQLYDDGPFYCYAPGEALHRIDAHDYVPHVWSGLVIPIQNDGAWRDPRETTFGTIGISPDGKSALATIFASVTRTLILEAPSWQNVKVFGITSFDRYLPEQIDINRFNQMVCPVPHGYDRYEIPATEWRKGKRWTDCAVELKVPESLDKILKEHGALKLRRKWLEEASEELTTIGDSQLRQLYRRAIEEMLAANETYTRYAAAHIKSAEGEIRVAMTGKAGKGDYDGYDRRLLWYLGEAGIDTTQKQQPVVVQFPEGFQQQAAAAPNFDIGATIAAAVQQGITAGLASQKQTAPASSSSRRSHRASNKGRSLPNKGASQLSATFQDTEPPDPVEAEQGAD